MHLKKGSELGKTSPCFTFFASRLYFNFFLLELKVADEPLAQFDNPVPGAL
jgi:hypothetical protein